MIDLWGLFVYSFVIALGAAVALSVVLMAWVIAKVIYTVLILWTRHDETDES